ncbi:MAG: hypothetical protein A3F72_13300 [Bacteroidetes bacterium RIFCSPLOWO2_12_FULL_35_15]|nr:MAG: hypothetical protein A3F72_13300 [Bacteroidetes bacterium RIFCSPLOWO2_12_FULL_35_15]
MLLLYFKITDSPVELKKKRNALVKLYHPDLNKNRDTNAIMQQINMEYDYVLSNRQQPKQETFTRDNNFLKQAAQNIFHALTNGNGVDYILLANTIKSIPSGQLKPLTIIYFQQYGFQLINHIQDRIKDKKIQDAILISMKIATGNVELNDVFSFFRSFK